MKKRFLILTLVFIILFSISVSAVGLSSWGHVVKKTDFLPGEQITYPYMLRTTTNFAQDYELIAGGELAHLITFSPSGYLENVEPGSDPWFNVILNFPESDEDIEPGIHKISITVKELGEQDGTITARTAVSTRIEVRVLHPGQYLISSFNAPNTNINEPSKMTLSLDNWGKQTIESCQAEINVQTNEGEFKETIYSTTTSIPSATSTSSYAVLDTLGYLPGDYYASGIINWDGHTTSINDTFKIGNLDVKMLSYTGNFAKETINPFKINIESGWNSPIENVYAIIDGLPNGPIQTPTIQLKPWENINLSTYWDTAGVELGTYPAKLTLYYADKKQTEDISVEVFESIDVQEQKPLGLSYNYLLIIIITLVLFNVGLLIFLFKKRNKPTKTLNKNK